MRNGFLAKAAMAMIAIALAGCMQKEETPKKIIFDTDWWTDVDDACAIRLARNLQDQGLIQLAGVCLSALDSTSIPSISAFLSEEGLGDIPVGVDKRSDCYPGSPSYRSTILENCPAGRYSHADGCDDCVEFYRKILSQTEGKTDIVAVGFPNTLARLLESGPDGISDLTGEELIKKKVGHLWMMAGKYPEGKEHNFCLNGYSRKSGAAVCADWPTEITFLGFEVGIRVKAGGKLSEDDILKKILNVHGSFQGRYAWDPLTLLLAASDKPEDIGFSTVTGSIVFDESDGSNSFSPSEDGKHRYVVMTREPQFYADTLDFLFATKEITDY